PGVSARAAVLVDGSVYVAAGLEDYPDALRATNTRPDCEQDDRFSLVDRWAAVQPSVGETGTRQPPYWFEVRTDDARFTGAQWESVLLRIQLDDRTELPVGPAFETDVGSMPPWSMVLECDGSRFRALSISAR
ncbi:MAG TPA: hypothetical protein VLI04_09230, partial [Nocardioidaceae bacterium]|nr:hypothetical protein [Nocardioidaceae bacterium]